MKETLTRNGINILKESLDVLSYDAFLRADLTRNSAHKKKSQDGFVDLR